LLFVLLLFLLRRSYIHKVCCTYRGKRQEQVETAPIKTEFARRDESSEKAYDEYVERLQEALDEYVERVAEMDR
jgi:hypothetical protein